MIIVLGPTASGKTSLAVQIAHSTAGEIISADSRQVYRRMTLGTGKDLEEYGTGESYVPYHLIDIAEPGYEYNVYEFLRGVARVTDDILKRGKKPILCGGSGMYIDAVLKGYRLPEARHDPILLRDLESKTDEELRELVKSTKKLHNTTDLSGRERMIRALIIPADPGDIHGLPPVGNDHLILGISFERETLRKRITERLKKRLESGMIREVEQLLAEGLTPDQLKFYGLEYRYITRYTEGELTYDEMFRQLNTAIHQLAKRQMTWFRKMEREGHVVHWIDGTLEPEDKLRVSLDLIRKKYLPA
jgi:tRNA dimethylallyltransferase